MVKAVILVNISPEKTKNTFEKVNKFPEVTESFLVYGEYDSVFVVNTKNTHGIQDLVMKIRKIPGVLRTVTVIEMI
ncbi:MAG: regulatory protein AsnC/Lrp family [Candidatus Parvarchaeum acidophilus ARMAN-5]|jgi:DNA-binding Lrp family transcriptional regulator|uniref:Regulatory protein AsnC/Lrp family n=1 Tax=Candidatus Parvarchaeum acidophilus ARMAN-5 TaxID=662762 RepID=D6GUF2_PARA5|nr:MAG: regulatory protein AsnC/Lrp family [Candidatus Parvarchaeum acidophilus ARMAN-5]